MSAIRVGTLVEAMFAVGIPSTGRDPASPRDRRDVGSRDATVLSFVDHVDHSVDGEDPFGRDDGPEVG